MKAVVCRELGPPSNLRIEEVEPQSLQADEVRVRIKAAGINFPDVLMAAGGYQLKPELPFTPGMEAAGNIIELGAAISEWKVGDRVLVKKRYGAFAEQVVLPVADLKAIPGPFDYAEAAAFSVAYFTAYHCLVVRGNLQPGETLLVHGATGGVGLAAVEIGKYLGATVIATGGRDDKLEVVKSLGADHVINYETSEFRQIVNDLTDSQGADVIYDPVGGAVFEQSLRCISWGGRLLVIGFTSGKYGNLPANYALLKGCSVIGCRAGEYGRHYPTEGAQAMAEFLKLANDGVFHPYISHKIPFPEIADAMQVLLDREVIGKVVMTFG